MAEAITLSDNKPTFFQSMKRGMAGYIKGLFAGAFVGASTGAIVGGVLGALGVVIGTVSGILPMAAFGMGIGVALFSGIGALSGMATEVVRSREASQVSGQDVANVAKIAFTQGVQVGHQATLAQEAEGKTANFRKMIEDRRAQETAQEKTR